MPRSPHRTLRRLLAGAALSAGVVTGAVGIAQVPRAEALPPAPWTGNRQCREYGSDSLFCDGNRRFQQQVERDWRRLTNGIGECRRYTGGIHCWQ